MVIVMRTRPEPPAPPPMPPHCPAGAPPAPALDRHLSAVREGVGAPAEDRRRARELRRGLPRVETDVIHTLIRPLGHGAAKRGVAIFSCHGYDAVAVRVVERLLVPRFGISLLDAVRPPSPATAERHQ